MSSPAAHESEPGQYPVAPIVASRSRRLGLVAMIVGLGVFAGSVLASVLIGIAASPYARSSSSGFNVNLRLDSGDPVESTLAVLAFVHMLLGTALGLWALTQGIVAIATRRGRGFGIVGVVAASLAPGVSLAVYLATAVTHVSR